MAREELGTDADLPAGRPVRSTSTASQLLALVVAIEDHFEISFSPEDDEAVSTLDDVAACVQRHLRAQATAPDLPGPSTDGGADD